MHFKFSVIIPALNEENYIIHVLNALKRQSFKDFEVIVVDAHSTDNTLRVVKTFEKYYTLTTLSNDLKNVSSSRNLGAKTARGQYLFFIDADNSIEDNFFLVIKSYLEKNPNQVIIPKIIPELHNRGFFMRSIFAFLSLIVDLFLHTPTPFSTGSSLIVGKELFYKIGGYDQKLFVGEDHEIVHRLKRHHAKLNYAKDAVVIFSTRRFKKEGVSLYAKYVYSSLYIMVFGPIKRRLYPYEMGGKYFEK